MKNKTEKPDWKCKHCGSTYTNEEVFDSETHMKREELVNIDPCGEDYLLERLKK